MAKKQLTDQEIEKISTVADINHEKRTISMKFDQESEEFGLVKPHIYLAEYNGWKIIKKEPKQPSDTLSITESVVSYQLHEKTYLKRKYVVDKAYTNHQWTGIVTGELQDAQKDEHLERRILLRTGKNPDHHTIRIQGLKVLIKLAEVRRK